MSAVLAALGTMGAVVALGWVLGRWRVLGERAAPVLARVVFVVAAPALLLSTVAHADLHLLVSRTAVVTWTSTALVALLAALVLRVVWHRSAADVTVGTLVSSYVNAGNIGLPLAVYLLDDPVVVVPTLLFQLLVLAPVAFAVLDARPAPPLDGPEPAGTGPDGSDTAPAGMRVAGVARRTLSNPIIVGTLVGLVLAALPWSVPEVVLQPFALVGAAAAPLALLTFGMSLAAPRTTADAAPRRDLALAVGLRSVVHPVLTWGVGTALGLPAPALLAVVAMAALPTAQNVLVYAMQYRHGEALARDAGLLTTVLCVPVLLVVAAALG
ncbi:AEC family transporter [Cellulomonas sp. zg-ZUI199]|uniref:AEC family transporter n=1 Tax=Cellulomonas wangleii TaxID=2816956 RepID=A0ABX8D420_9CELL|nr:MULTISPECIES: AEC family transporter [Cellulomonas]MBO0899262.1 AEC family transporter [Cellulomonas sp. zg-ZUI22]MBO0923458.1 AEC family transporter [Cellulomonas wangleii]QVI61803.1 AEC family transporter [Cellulomonas wangleii]